MGEAVRGALTELGADPCGDVALHELGGHPGHALEQHVGVLVAEELVGQLGSGHPGPLGHRGASFVDPWNRPTIMRPAVAELTSGPTALLHHSHRLDPSAGGPRDPKHQCLARCSGRTTAQECFLTGPVNHYLSHCDRPSIYVQAHHLLSRHQMQLFFSSACTG